MSEEQTFLFDDFFVDEADPGVVHTVTIRGREVPITCSRGISLADKEAATQASVKRHVAPNGKIVVDGIDDTALAVELLMRCIKSWPFTYKDGSTVPINRRNIRMLLSDACDALALAIIGVGAAKEAEADGPFAPPSEEA
jgi:hypothetical protein